MKQENHEAAQKNVVYVQNSLDTIRQNIETIHVMMKRPKGFHGSITTTMTFEAFHDAAWRTARDTGALSYMPYEEVQRYSNVYMLEQMVNQKATDTAERNFRASAPVYMGFEMETLPESEYMDMLRGNASTQMDLTVLKQYVQQLDKQCVKELKR